MTVSAARWAVIAAALPVGVLAAPLPALADPVSAPYTCTSILGTDAVTITGELVATPNPAAAGSPVAFDLTVTDLGLTAPLRIKSWSGTAVLQVSGAETGSFTLAGSGGAIPAGDPITGELTGSWTPSVAGTDTLTGGAVDITADVQLIGSVKLACTPDAGQPAAGTLTVQ
ncbi:hypothetical protein [Paractinoplanes durhamensis]|uniref:Uncharacterized protein n=1 Tax=Paractinoplanes durhamensis TaxID=113563 RepID=A0ABQ3YRX5_9ACTN|nr:hypothetical protein [Actinoplanes durhamensis]GIE00306.1 hypothetical protein Adu01nite_16560 [Actinoplanes durhamensis]